MLAGIWLGGAWLQSEAAVQPELLAKRESSVKLTLSLPAILVSADGAFLFAETVPDLSGEIPAEVFTPEPFLLQTFLSGMFEGLSNPAGSITRPPDPQGAAGPSMLLEVTNNRIGAFNKGPGMQWGPLAWNAFFTPTLTGSFVTDPRVTYDHSSGRFIVVILEYLTTFQNSYLHVAVSKDSNPEDGTPANWWRFGFQVQETAGANTYFADYPSIAVDDDNLYVTANMFRVPSPGSTVFDRVRLMVLPKQPILSGGTLAVTFRGTPIGGLEAGGFTLQPATVVGSEHPANIAFFAETPYTTNQNQIRVWTIADPSGAATLGGPFVVALPASNGGYIDFAPQGSVGDPLNTVPLRTMSAVWNRDSLWFCHTAGGTSGAATIHYYRVDTSAMPLGAPVLAEQGTVPKSSAADWNYVPNLSVNDRGEIGVVCTESSATLTARIKVATRGGRGVTAFEPSVTEFSSSTYSGALQNGSLRWGDYAGASFDPVDQTFWMVSEWAKPNTAAYRWSTGWIHANPALSYIAQDDLGTNADDVAVATAVDASGSVYVCGNTVSTSTGQDIFVAKYDLDGYLSSSWPDVGDGVGRRRYAGSGGFTTQAASALVVRDGFVYISGNTVLGSNQDNLVVLKIATADGQFSTTWPVTATDPIAGVRTKLPGSLTNKSNGANALAVDGTGNVFVTGWVLFGTPANNTAYDYLTVAINAAGTFSWQSVYAPFANFFADDVANAVAVDGLGNVYVTGASSTGTSGSDYATVKYNFTTGAQVWAKRFDAGGSQPLGIGDTARALAFDLGNNVFVTGGSRSTSENAYNVVTLKYTPTGTQSWVKTFDVAATSASEEGISIAVDKSVSGGDVFVGGRSATKVLLLRYTNAGAASSAWLAAGSDPVGARTYPTLTAEAGLLQPFALNQTTKELYITGRLSDGHLQTLSQTASGSAGWSETLLSAQTRSDSPVAVLRDSFGGAIVVGTAAPVGAGNSDLLQVRYNPH